VTSSPLNERARQHYLNQMGVTLWYSRCEIPGAAVSPIFDFGENTVAKESAPTPVKSAADILSNLSASSASVSVPEVRAPESKAPVKQAAASMQNTPDTQSTTVPELSPTIHPVVEPVFVTPPPSVHVNETKQEAVEELALMLWVGKSHWFITDNDSEFPDILKQQLLLNIASAIGETVEGVEVTRFNWPFFGNRRLPGNDRGSMFSLLLEWVSKQLVSDELSGFLMGEKITRFLLQNPSSNVCEMNGQEIELSLSDERGVMVVPTLSLNDMLRTPSNKKQVWQHLKPYHIK